MADYKYSVQDEDCIDEEFIQAVADGSIKDVESIMSQGYQLGEHLDEEQAHIQACLNEDTEMIRFLSNFKTLNYSSSILSGAAMAADDGNLEILQIYTSLSANLLLDMTVVDAAVKGGHLDVVAYFIEELSLDPHVDKSSLVIGAAAHDSEEVFVYLMEKTNFKDHTGNDYCWKDKTIGESVQAVLCNYQLTSVMTSVFESMGTINSEVNNSEINACQTPVFSI